MIFDISRLLYSNLSFSCQTKALRYPFFVVLLSFFCVLLGIVILIGCACIAAYNGNLLGKCWMLIKQRYPEYNRRFVTDPYPAIGFRAAGKWGQYATRICILFTCFGGGKNEVPYSSTTKGVELY